ncbi:MAG: hypothetical protein Q9201_006288 [Fulgogasparrea decipioides]
MSVPELPPSIYDQVGRLLGKEESQQCFELFWGIIEEAFQYSNKESASIPQDQSLLDFFKIKVQEKNLSEPIKKRVLDLCESWGDYIGGTIDRQSLKYFFLEETVDEGNLFLASTYRAVLDRITKDTYAQANIQLSTKVTSVRSSASTADEDSLDGSSGVTVTTAQNTTSEYDEVVMTAPLGWLKRNLSTFHPPLPPRLQTAITNISYGRLEKVYLTFPTAFWLPPKSDETHNAPLNPFFTQWLTPAYTPHRWPVECHNFLPRPFLTNLSRSPHRFLQTILLPPPQLHPQQQQNGPDPRARNKLAKRRTRRLGLLLEFPDLVAQGGREGGVG